MCFILVRAALFQPFTLVYFDCIRACNIGMEVLKNEKGTAVEAVAKAIQALEV